MEEGCSILYAQVDGNLNGDETALKMQSFMKEHAGVIHHLVDRAEALSQKIQEQSPEFVLCHSDIHGGNVLIDESGSIFIVDWDDPIMASKERDLMFIGGGVANVWNNPHEEEFFYKGYGKTEINRTILAYYRYERIVEDIAEYGQALLLTSDGGKDRLEMFKQFRGMFEPKGVVDIAFKTDEGNSRIIGTAIQNYSLEKKLHLSEFHFSPAESSQISLIHGWLQQDHIKEWIHGMGLQNTLNGLEKFFRGESSTTYWIGYHKGTPFAFLITSPEGSDATTLDLFICDLNYLGKGLAVPMIREFLTSQFSNVKKVLIDPEATNKRAIHVYQKAGFKIIGEFIASWHPVLHYQMELCMEDLLNPKKEIGA